MVGNKELFFHGKDKETNSIHNKHICLTLMQKQYYKIIAKL